MITLAVIKECNSISELQKLWDFTLTENYKLEKLGFINRNIRLRAFTLNEPSEKIDEFTHRLEVFYREKFWFYFD